MKKTNLTIKKYDSNKVYVVVDWTGTFEYKPTEKEVRTYTEVFEFNSIPTEQDLKIKLEELQQNIIKRSDWSDIIILGYSILPQMTTTKIILK